MFSIFILTDDGGVDKHAPLFLIGDGGLIRKSFDESLNTIAELMTDGCNMGVKSLNKYLNEYKAADDRAKDKTKRLIELEKKLCEQMQPFL